MRTGYEVQFLECCLTCRHNDMVDDILLCALVHETVKPLAICDQYEYDQTKEEI